MGEYTAFIKKMHQKLGLDLTLYKRSPDEKKDIFKRINGAFKILICTIMLY